ncbi:aminotransferase class I/II-fold pyridoxal phosphate-dependent enzyme [Micrococcales bacterium 31B]|nr:aminotransferase class I/II-fold pyridoxal phosphate-dependent enzyme [Micrococcales bacterium 31B]
MTTRPALEQPSRLASVRYDLRGRILQSVERLEAAGEPVIKLNIGNPAPFDFPVPDWLVEAAERAAKDSGGYSESQGLLDARWAVSRRYHEIGVDIKPADIFLGNGVSELIMMSVQAMIGLGDEVLLPAPDYPLWTAAVRLSGGVPVHYVCRDDNEFIPTVDDIEAAITPRTKALVLINPNNPTGALYDAATLKSLLELADRHHLVVLADEIYDEILFDDAEFTSVSQLGEGLRYICYGGLSKVWRAAGYRAGWMVLSDALAAETAFMEGLHLLANLRLCPNVIAQRAIEAAVNQGRGGADDLVQPGGRLRVQRDVLVEALNQIDGVECVLPKGALYAFPSVDLDKFTFSGDEDLSVSLLEEEHLLVTHGTGFNLSHSPHLRFVFLAQQEILEESVSRLARHLERHRL